MIGNYKGLLISAILTLGIVWFIPDVQLLILMILSGHAHFIIAYLYTNKAGKIDALYLKRFFIMLLAFFITALYILLINTQMFTYFVFFTIIIFVIHYVNDEMKLLDFHTENKILLTCATAFFFIPTIWNKLIHNSQILNIAGPIIGLIFIAVYIFNNRDNLSLKKIKKEPVYYFIFLNIMIITLINHATRMSVVQIASFIIFFHYIRWYLYYFFKLSGEEKSFYLKSVLWIHILVFLMFILYSLDIHNVLLVYFFHPVFFYMWTVIHIFMSIRISDYKLTKLL